MAINILSGRRHNIWKDISKDWLTRILRLPDRYTAVTNHNTLRHYTEESTTNQSIGEEDDQETLVQNIFNTPMILLPWNPRLENTPREDSLFYDGRYPKSRIVNLLRSTAFNFGMVVEDHQSMKGVILDLQPNKRTTIC